MGFTPYREPELPQGDVYKPIDHIGSTLIVKVKEKKEGIVTANSPDGGPGVIVDLVDLDTTQIYRDVLWMGGAMVDGLKQYVTQTVVIRLEARKSKSNRNYPAPVGVDGPSVARAERYVADHGDPFAAQLATVTNDTPPF